MYKLVIFTIPNHAKREPDNYYAARMKVMLHYGNEYFWSDEDRSYYIFTKDSPEDVIENIAYTASPNTEDCTFRTIGLPLSLEMFPKPASEWLEGQIVSLERLHNLYQELRKGIVES